MNSNWPNLLGYAANGSNVYSRVGPVIGSTRLGRVSKWSSLLCQELGLSRRNLQNAPKRNRAGTPAFKKLELALSTYSNEKRIFHRA